MKVKLVQKTGNVKVLDDFTLFEKKVREGAKISSNLKPLMGTDIMLSKNFEPKNTAPSKLKKCIQTNTIGAAVLGYYGLSLLDMPKGSNIETRVPFAWLEETVPTKYLKFIDIEATIYGLRAKNGDMTWMDVIRVFEGVIHRNLKKFTENRLKTSNTRVELAKFLIWLYLGIKEHEDKYNKS